MLCTDLDVFIQPNGSDEHPEYKNLLMNCWATLSSSKMLLCGLHWLQKYFKNGLSGVCFYFLRAPVLGDLLCLPSLSPEIGGTLLS